MKQLADNYKIVFKNITKDKDNIIAKFKVKALRNGIYLEAVISVDITELELYHNSSLGDIITKCANKIQREIKNIPFEIEDQADNLSVAQLG